jgi:alkylation response protein AidB-like acyl-CoA dehydrogenase
MDFDLTDDQKLLVTTVAAFARKDSPPERLRRMRKHELGWEKKVWKQMGELGWLGVLYPERLGGLGASFVEAGLILEQLGNTLVPEPYLDSAVVAGRLILRAGSEKQQEQWLGPMVRGDESLALAWAEEQSRFDTCDVQTRAERRGAGWRLGGKKRFVLNGHAADHVVVSARTAGEKRDRAGVSLFVVDPGMPGVTIRKVDCMDSHKAAFVELAGVEVGPERLLGPEGGAAAALEHALDDGAAAACCEGSGILQAMLAMTRNYLCEREQFGTKIGTFQALQHRCVDMFVETELAKSTAVLAMLEIDDPDEEQRQRAISAAKVQLSVGGAFVGKQAIQLHGGIGVTDEHDVSLFFKRIHVLSTLFGDEQFHVQRFARLPGFVRNVTEGAA